MTSLKKLSICGVRSYSQQEPENIEFLKPLTIIVGANGAGKTSIIESLKFIATGSLPPVSDGGRSFVHDPKMEGTNLIKAQVKLSFETAEKKSVVAIRNFQLSQKAGKREFKGMEAVLRTKDAEGKEQSISQKCADMEKLVPELMGVSPAVLENVIFLHQEDSLWPLSDPKTLKTKFDDIFAATRYTKALENISKLKKDRAAEIRVMEADLKGIEQRVEQAHKFEDDLTRTKEIIRSKAEESTRVSDEMKSIQSKLDKLGAKQKEIQDIQDQINSLKAKEDVMVQEKNAAFKRMRHEYNETDEALNQTFELFKQRHAQLLKGITEKTETMKKLEQEAARGEQQMAKMNEELGKLAAQESEYNQKRQDLIELSTRLGSTAGGRDHVKLLQELKAAFEAKQNELAAARTEGRSLDAKFESDITRAREEESGLNEQMRLKRDQMEACTGKSERIKKQKANLEAAAKAHQSIQEQFKQAQNEMAAIAKSHDPECDALKQQIDAKMRQTQTNTQKLSVLREQRKQLASQQESLAQIKLKRTQLQNLLGLFQQGYDKLKLESEEHKLYDSTAFPRPLPNADGLKAVFPSSSDSAAGSSADSYRLDRYEKQLKNRFGELKNDVKKKSDELSDVNSQLSALQGQRKAIVDQRLEQDEQLAEIRSKFAAAELVHLLDGTQAQLDEELNKARALFEKCNTELHLGATAAKIYSNFGKTARDKSCCGLCLREFGDLAALEAFIANIESKVSQLQSAEKKEIQKQNQKIAKQRVEQTMALVPLFTSATQLKQSQASKQADIDKIETEVSMALSRKATVEMELSELKEREEVMLEHMKAANSVAQYFRDVQQSFSTLQSSEKALQAEAAAAAAAAGSTKVLTLEVVTNEYEAIERLNVTLQRENNELQEKLEALRSKKQKVQDNVNKLQNQLSEMTRTVDQLDRLKVDEKENYAAYQTLKAEVEKASAELGKVSQRIKEVGTERASVRAQTSQQERSLSESVAGMQRELDKYKSLVADVERYESQLKDRQEMKQDLVTKQKTFARMREERSAIRDQLNVDQTKANENETLKVEIEANIQFRKRKADIEAHHVKIDELKRQLQAVSGNQLLDDLRSLQATLQKRSARKSELKGENDTYAKRFEELVTTLKGKDFFGIDERYKTKKIEVTTHILANQDLDTYHRALDRALMHYHSLKMKEINETLKDYWGTVYKGADIDEIKIVSDGAVVGNKRNYNYRVVMKQGDTELDMRGRCSAGQKVLASLLIRLALADTFCTQCAVLALDEPTTNLDHKNITAFAQALNQIIEKRREQSNFQLIVITHDETFVDEIGKRAHAEYYYRVYKDQAQHSKIRRQAIEHDDEH